MTTAINLKQFLIAPNNFTDLELTGQGIDDNNCIEIAQALKNNSTIKNIHLNNNQIGDIGITALANVLKTNSSISGLRLSNNQISKLGADSLGQMLNGHKSLYWLFIDNNKIEDDGLIALANGLQTNKVLSQLNLANNQIGDVGAIAFGNKFPLHELNLNNNQIGNKGAIALAKTSTQLEHSGFMLHLENNPIETDVIDCFKTITNVRLYYTKHEPQILEIKYKESLEIQNKNSLTELEKALAYIKELEAENTKQKELLKQLEKAIANKDKDLDYAHNMILDKDKIIDLQSCTINELREDKTEIKIEKNEWKFKYDVKDNSLQKMIEELVIEKSKVSEFTQKLAVQNHDAQNISSFSIIEHAEIFNIGEGTFENQNDL